MKNTAALVVAAVVTAVYVVALILLWDKVGDGDTAWARRLVLFGGLEAIVFAAVGWLFGKEVNRHAVDAAAEANKVAAEKAQERGEAEGKGRALADAIRAADSAGGFERAPAGSNTTLRALADNLFPTT